MGNTQGATAKQRPRIYRNDRPKMQLHSRATSLHGSCKGLLRSLQPWGNRIALCTNRNFCVSGLPNQAETKVTQPNIEFKKRRLHGQHKCPQCKDSNKLSDLHSSCQTILQSSNHFQFNNHSTLLKFFHHFFDWLLTPIAFSKTF